VRAALALTPVLLLTACPGPPPELCTGSANGTFAFELGTGGSDAFEPLTEGSELPMHFGPQGGQHVFVALRSTEVAPGLAEMRVRFTDPETGSERLPTLGATAAFLDRAPGGGLQVTGLMLTIDDPAKVLDQPVRVEAHVVDAQCREGVDARTVVVRWSNGP
jgi:hypothetical protein